MTGQSAPAPGYEQPLGARVHPLLAIRREQMEVFRSRARDAFADAMVNHLAAFSPPLFRSLGPPAVLSAVHGGIGQAAGYGFNQRGPVRLYLELMVLFGCRFDTDPQYPWARVALKGEGPQPQRAKDLYQRAIDYRRAVAGPGDAYALCALRNIRAWAAGKIDFSPDDLVPAMLAAITDLYPEKAAYVGREALTALINRGGEGARFQRFASPRAMALVVVLMLAFGHGCGTDPFYPWIAQTLRDEGLRDPVVRAERLEKRAETWLDRLLINDIDQSRGVVMSKGEPTDPCVGADFDTPCDAIAE